MGNCSDPKSVYESSVVSMDDLIESYKPYAYFSKDEQSEVQNDSKAIPIYVRTLDRANYGRCFTLHLAFASISSIELKFKQGVKIYFHSYGSMKTRNPRVYLRLGITERMTVALDYKVFEFLSTSDEPCQHDVHYNKDFCIDEALHKISLDTIGCTTPFGRNKSLICTDPQSAIKAKELYAKYFQHNSKFCPNPCTFSRMRASILYHNTSESRNTSLLYINLDDEISVSTSYYTYTGLSLIAEIGGYVGLFLGISLNQTYKLCDFLKIFVEKFTHQ